MYIGPQIANAHPAGVTIDYKMKNNTEIMV